MHRLALASAALSMVGSHFDAQTCGAPAGAVVLGAGTTGAGGVAPRLVNVGAPLVGTAYHLAIEQGAAGSIAVAIASVNEVAVALPQYGGVAYVGAPLLAAIPYALDGDGSAASVFAVGGIDPALCGLTVVAQAAVLDAGATGGWALTNGLRVAFGDASLPTFPNLEHGPADGKTFVPGGVGVGDLDEDGVLDVAYSSPLAPFLNVLVGLGDGSFAEPDDQGAGLHWAEDLELADLDGDGHLDAMVSQSEPGRISTKLGAGDGTLHGPQSYLLNSCSGFDLGDLDQDGSIDVVCADRLGDGLVVLANDGGGGLLPGVKHAAQTPFDVAAADFNGDGLPDLASTAYSGHTAQVRLNAGGGAFLAPVLTGVEKLARTLEAGDLDGDGLADLVVASSYFELHVLISRGDGSFMPAPDLPADTPQRVEIADLDGDGVNDVAAPDFGTGTVTAWLGVGDGTFVQGQVIPSGRVHAAKAADFDGDGLLDLVVAGGVPVLAQYTMGVAVHFGLGGGEFLSNDVYPAFALPHSIATADFDGDGRTDAMLGGTDVQGAQLAWFRAEPGGGLADVALLPSSAGYYSGILALDMDADGTADVVGSNWGNHTVDVVLTQPGPAFGPTMHHDNGGGSSYAPAAGDLNGDGAPDVVLSTHYPSGLRVLLGTGGGALGAATAYSTGAFPRQPALADLDGDGFLDVLVSQGEAFLQILPGNGDGTLGTAIELSSNAADSIALADLDDDGLLDLVGRASPGVHRRLGLGGFAFGPSATWSSYGLHGSIAIAEITGDDALDVIAVSEHPERATLLPGAGNGDFLPPSHYIGLSGAGPLGIAALDVDGNGMLDLLAADHRHHGLAVFRNQTLR